MKKEVAEYLKKCLECQQVKVEHQHSVGLMSPLHIRKWKLEIVSLHFIIELPGKKIQHNSIMVVVDTLSKETHFPPMQYTFGTTQIAQIFMNEFFWLHGIPKMRVLDKDAKFTLKFWKLLFGGVGTKLNFSTSYHPQTDGHTERTNQILEYMLRMYLRDKRIKWENFLHLAEFTYNNIYQESIKMSYFEPFYGRKCHTPLSWSQLEKRLILGPNALQE